MEIPHSWIESAGYACADSDVTPAPGVVVYHWAVATHGATETGAYSRVTFGDGFTGWWVIGWADDRLITLDAHSKTDEWIGGMREQGSGTAETQLYPFSALTSLTLHRYTVLDRGETDSKLSTNWTVHIAGRDFDVLARNEYHRQQADAVDQFITELRHQWRKHR